MITIFVFFNFLLFFIFTKFYKVIGVYDKPNLNLKTHKKKMPVYGGMIFFLNFILFFFLDLLHFNLIFDSLNRSNLVLLISSSAIFLMGLFDDKFELDAKNKTIQIIFFSFLLIISSEIFQIRSIHIENLGKINLNNFSIIFTILCVFTFINSYNMMDGADLNVALYNFFILTVLLYKTNVNELVLIFLISNILFFFLNFKKKTFFGNNGSYFFSFLLSFLIIYFFNTTTTLNEKNIILIMLCPVVELVRLFLTRIIGNKSPFIGDKNHLHHISQDYFGKRLGIIVCNLFAILPLFLDQLLKINLWYIVILFLIFYVSFIILLKKKIKIAKQN